MFRSPLFNDFVTLRETFDQVVNDRLGGPFATVWSRTGNSQIARPMPLDLYATDEQAVILAAVPGLKPEDLELTVHQNLVTLAGEIKSATETEGAKSATWFVHELASGKFRRTVTLPFPVDAERAEAVFEQGILRVTLPKAEHAKPRKIAIGGPRSSEQSLTTGAER